MDEGRDAERMASDADRAAERGATAGQLPIELILLRQLATYLDLPVFVVDAEGTLVFFNEPAEPLLGLRFDEVGELAMADWLAVFRPRGPAGEALADDAVPLVIALREARPVNARLTIAGLDGVRRVIDASCLPLRGQAEGLVGAVAWFWMTR